MTSRGRRTDVEEPWPDLSTLARARAPHSRTTPLSPPIQLSSVYRIAGLDEIDALYQGEASGYIYSRDGHPNASQLAERVAALEGAESALVCASGMAAEAAVLLAGLQQGDEVALSEGIYGKTVVLVGRELARFGVSFRVFDPTRAETLRDAISPRTRIAFAETISNPLVRVADVAGLAEVAHASDVSLVIDHTMAPLLCRPIELGADAVTHSLTKLIGGHSDLLLGLVVGGKDLVTRAGEVVSAFGLNGNPFESWLALRGVATLKLRSDRACANALELAGRLESHPSVRRVHYPGLETHADHARAARMFRGGFGTIVTIDVGDRPRADTFIRNLEHVPFAPSFGDTSTTLSHPCTTSHRGLSPEEQAAQGIGPGLVRLSIGLEDPADLWADFQRALDRV
ncbi:MAG: aminotransferase class I/II-fold pyridoxal phosphate-dependent enzyme [Isosphaeraceae bacterium]